MSQDLTHQDTQAQEGNKGRRLTLYQAEKYCKGEVSRYKLEQAIQEKQLMAYPGIKNRKWFIYEDDLKMFIEQYGYMYIKPIILAQDLSMQSHHSQKMISKELHESVVREKDRMIDLLQFQNTTILSQLQELLKDKS